MERSIALADDRSVAGFLDELGDSGNDMVVNALLVTYGSAYRLGWVESSNEYRSELLTHWVSHGEIVSNQERGCTVSA